MMRSYDPEAEPEAAEWLELDESERARLVEEYHEREREELANPRRHSLIHVVVENQIAGGESVVVDAMDRLRSEGLSRHDAIHAIGMVLSAHLSDIMDVGESEADAHERYFDRLETLTAEEWRKSE